MILPRDRTGNVWFWKLLREGESGVELSLRLPKLPEDMTEDKVFIWTKVSGGRRARAIVGVKQNDSLKAYGCTIDNGEVVTQ